MSFEEKERPVILVGSDGEQYKFRPLGPEAIDLLEEWAESRRLKRYEKFAQEAGHGVDERAATRAAITRDALTVSDLFRLLNSVPAQIYILSAQGKPYDKGMSEKKTRQLFAESIGPTFDLYLKESGLTLPEISEEEEGIERKAENPSIST